MERNDILDYETLVEAFNQELVLTLRNHSSAHPFLDYWVPDSDPVLGIAGMIDSARIAGYTQLAVRFRSASVPEPRVAELEKAVARFSTVSLTPEGDGYVLSAAQMTADGEPGGGRGGAVPRQKSAYWQVETSAFEALGDDRGTRFARASAAAETTPEPGGVHPRFRAGLAAAAQSCRREGDPGPVGDDLTRLESSESGVTLLLDVDIASHGVRRAYHRGAEDEALRGALELFCRMAEGLPLQEVADHVGLKVIDSLVDEAGGAPVAGVVLPINAGAAFMVAPRLARAIFEAYREARDLGEETNFYYPPPAQVWQKLSSRERTDRIALALGEFAALEKLEPGDIELLRLEDNRYGYEVRAVVQLGDRLDVNDKPFLMRRLEKHLRRVLETDVELVADRIKDTSPLRRLS